MSEFEPRSTRELLALVDICKLAIANHRRPNGELSGLGIKVLTAALESLEAKLGGERRGPVGVPSTPDR